MIIFFRKRPHFLPLFSVIAYNLFFSVLIFEEWFGYSLDEDLVLLIFGLIVQSLFISLLNFMFIRLHRSGHKWGKWITRSLLQLYIVGLVLLFLELIFEQIEYSKSMGLEVAFEPMFLVFLGMMFIHIITEIWLVVFRFDAPHGGTDNTHVLDA